VFMHLKNLIHCHGKQFKNWFQVDLL